MLDLTPLGEKDRIRVVNAYRLRGCLAAQAVSAQNDVVLLTDRSRVVLTDGAPEKTSRANYWDPDAPATLRGPNLNGVPATSTARVDTRVVGGKRIEGWVGAWPTRGGSVIAFFTRDGHRLGEPRILASLKVKIVNVRAAPGSVDGPQVILSFLAEDPESGKIAASIYWFASAVFEGT